MNIEYTNNFIGVYKNVYPAGFCSKIINLVNDAYSKQLGYNRQDGEGVDAHKKSDLSISGDLIYDNFNGKKIQEVYREGLQACFLNYKLKYSILNDINVNCLDMKIQKTSPGEGYHIWHFESGAPNLMASRVLTFILYLNTLKPEDAGETEFLYQQKRFSPEENTMLIWPAHFTHVHRGNPVFNTHKYIITGWFYQV